MSITIQFIPNPETNVGHYNVYRSDNQSPTGTYTKIGEVPTVEGATELTYTDSAGTADDYYKLSSVTYSSIESLSTSAFKPLRRSILTRLYDVIFDAGMKPLEGISVEARLTIPQAKITGNDSIVVAHYVSAMTDHTGTWFMDLYPNNLLTPEGSQYLITIQGTQPSQYITLPQAVVISYSSLVTLY